MGITLRPATISYVPATTRATMYALGRPVTANIGNETIALSPTEMLGEIDWRAKFLLWLMRFTMFNLVMLSPEERTDCFENFEQALVLESRLHAVEACAVAELALHSVNALSDKQVASLKKRLPMYVEALEREWTRLAARYEEMVRANNTSE